MLAITIILSLLFIGFIIYCVRSFKKYMKEMAKEEELLEQTEREMYDIDK